jgi:hypothetical protein
MKAHSSVMMDESFPVRLEEDREEEFSNNLANESSHVVGEYSSIFTSQQLTVSQNTTIHKQPIPFPLRSIHTHNHCFESDPKASCFLGSLLNGNLQKMVEFTTENGLVETPLAVSPITKKFPHRPTAVITSSHCPTSRKRKCKRFKTAGEYFKKKKYTPRPPPPQSVA